MPQTETLHLLAKRLLEQTNNDRPSVVEALMIRALLELFNGDEEKALSWLRSPQRLLSVDMLKLGADATVRGVAHAARPPKVIFDEPAPVAASAKSGRIKEEAGAPRRQGQALIGVIQSARNILLDSYTLFGGTIKLGDAKYSDLRKSAECRRQQGLANFVRADFENTIADRMYPLSDAPVRETITDAVAVEIYNETHFAGANDAA